MTASLRHICALLVVLILGLGPMLHGVQAGDMTWDMASSAAGKQIPSGCDGCGDDDGDMRSTDCAFLCAGSSAILPMKSAAVLPHAAEPFASRVAADPGRAGPPDPYPPRGSISA